MTRPHVPQEILDAAHARKQARRARDWAEADRLKAAIEAGGWRVVDRGADFALSPLHPADIEADGRTGFGWSGAVPSVLGEPVTAPATVVARATSLAGVDAARSLVAAGPAGTQLVMVVTGGAATAAPILAAAEQAPEAPAEAVWLAADEDDRGAAGLAAAWNAGLRRSRGAVVVFAGEGVHATGGDVIAPLVAALAHPDTAVAGARALVGAAVQDLAPGAATGYVPAVDDTLLACRREDAAARAPLDERFHDPRLLAAWWSLTLRDDEDAEAPRSAVAVPGVPVTRDPAPAARIGVGEDGGEPDRAARRDRYRLLDAFRDRDDLLRGPAAG